MPTSTDILRMKQGILRSETRLSSTARPCLKSQMKQNPKQTNKKNRGTRSVGKWMSQAVACAYNKWSLDATALSGEYRIPHQLQTTELSSQGTEPPARQAFL